MRLMACALAAAAEAHGAGALGASGASPYAGFFVLAGRKHCASPTLGGFILIIAEYLKR
jgi:hypothetical protein